MIGWLINIKLSDILSPGVLEDSNSYFGSVDANGDEMESVFPSLIVLVGSTLTLVGLKGSTLILVAIMCWEVFGELGL